MLPTIIKFTENTQENKKLLAISLAAYLVNSALADIQDDDQFVFKVVYMVTGMLAPYAALSMLVPKWFTWYGFLAIIFIAIIVLACSYP